MYSKYAARGFQISTFIWLPLTFSLRERRCKGKRCELLRLPHRDEESCFAAAFQRRARKPVGRSCPPRPLQFEQLEDRRLLTLLGQQIFPLDYPWNQNISNAPVAANSAAIISHIGSSIPIHPDWGEDSASNGRAALYGIPYNVVHGQTTAKINVIIDNYPGESDIVPVPIPAGAVIEGDYQNGPNPNGGGYKTGQRGDSHLIVWDEDSNTAYELYGVTRPSDPKLFPNTKGVELAHTDGQWHAASETVWHMSTDDFRTLGYTSADAAGLSILAGLARPDEGLTVAQGGQGAINHALRLTLPSGDVNPQYIYPASHMVSTSADTNNLPLRPSPPDEQRDRQQYHQRHLDHARHAAGVKDHCPGHAEIWTRAGGHRQRDVRHGDVRLASHKQQYRPDLGHVRHTCQQWADGVTAADFEVVNLTPVVTGLAHRAAGPTARSSSTA